MDKSKTPAVFGSTDLPAHLQNSEGLGNENVSAEHLSTPTIKQVQNTNLANFADGTKGGDWMLTPQDKNMGQTLYAVPIKFEEKWLIWGAEQGENPPLATHYSEAAAISDLPNHEQDARLTQTHEHIFLIMDPETGKLDAVPAKLSMATSKLSTSKSLNTQIMARPGDRFSAVWKLTSSLKKTSKHNYYVADVEFQAYLNEPEYLIAKQVYQNVTGARSAAA